MRREDVSTIDAEQAGDRGFESRRYVGDGLDMHALVRDGRGPAIVLLHGAASNALAFLPILEAFDDRRLVCVDLPGHGRSEPIHDWTLGPLAHRLADVIGDAESAPLVWGGHSWGGKLAAVIAGARPRVTLGALLIDPSPATPVPITAEAFVASALEPEIGPWKSLDDAIASVRTLPQYAHWRPEIERCFVRGVERRPDGQIASRVAREWLVEISEATLLRDESGTLSKIRCPTLVVFAEESLSWQEPTNGAVFGALPNADRVTLPGNHWLTFEPPERLVSEIRRWLSRVVDG